MNQHLRLPQAGPQKTLYIPGVLFEMGKNTIHVFENYLGAQVITPLFFIIFTKNIVLGDEVH